VSNTSRFLLSAGVSEFQASQPADTQVIRARAKLHCAVQSPESARETSGTRRRVPSTSTPPSIPHAIMMTCFRPLTRSSPSAQAWAQLSHTPPITSSSVSAFSLLVCSRIGRLAEFQVKAFPITAITSDQTKTALVNQAVAASLSSSPGSDAVATLAQNLMGTMGTLVGGMKELLSQPSFYHDEPSSSGRGTRYAVGRGFSVEVSFHHRFCFHVLLDSVVVTALPSPTSHRVSGSLHVLTRASPLALQLSDSFWA
jgi:hypothetical protein